MTQRKNKYNTPKYRFVVRKTNKRIICQVVWSTMIGDRVKSEANSYEFKKLGLTAGLANYSAAYCTGLLCAKRLLKVIDDDNNAKGVEFEQTFSKMYDLVKEADGNYVDINKLYETKGVQLKPFTCFLDLGLTRATVGNRVFGAVKGAIDGGINIPCKEKIFPYIREAKKGDKKAASQSKTPHRDRIWSSCQQLHGVIKEISRKIQIALQKMG